MDLFSAAKRLNEPFVFKSPGDHAHLPMGARGIIGDGFSAALVRVDGIIDWLCFPRFDSPSVFAGIVDSQKGGSTGIRPASYPFTSLQSYDPNTNVLETLFRVEGQGVVRVTDYMPWENDPRLSVHEIHRRVLCVEGQVDLVATFDPRFNYGLDTPSIETNEHGAIAEGKEGERMVAAVSGAPQWKHCPQGGIEATISMRSGDRKWMILTWDAPSPEPIPAYRPFERLRVTRHNWREWARDLNYDGPWRHHVSRSALLLKLLMYAPTGAMVAAPTTSLPEWIGGVRNWDYRYTWTRDTAMAIQATALMGFVHEARDFFHFVRDTLDHDETLQIMYSIQGKSVPEERVLEHLSGFEGSSPVRIGNGARDQVQLDTAGALLDAAFIYEKSGGALPLRTWRNLRKVVADVCEGWQLADHGIWEPRNGTRHNVHSKLMSWVALNRGARLATLFNERERIRHWRKIAAMVKQDVCKHGLDETGTHFVSSYGENVPDASLLLLPLLGFLPPEDPRVVKTVQWIREELGRGPYLMRYENADGVGGKEGAFVLCGFWLAEFLAMSGRLDEAHDIFIQHAEASNHLGLLAEEIDPDSHTLLGNFPQAFSHLGLINAAARLDLALRLRDEGSKETPEFHH